MAKSILLLVKSHFKPELEALGYQVRALAPAGERSPTRPDTWSMEGCEGEFADLASVSEILDQIAPFSPDFILYHDDSSLHLRVADLHTAPIPTILYSVDAHIHASWHSQVSSIFDHTFVAQKKYLSTHWHDRPSASWLPLWAPAMITPAQPKDIPVCFRGSLGLPQRQARVDFLRRVAAAVPLDFAEGDFRATFPRSAIVLNEQIRDDINFRVFESVMCGACLVTPASGNGLDQLFTAGEQIVTYEPNNALDAIEKIKQLLAHPDRRQQIADAGRAHLLTHHLAKHRAEEIDRVLGTLRINRPAHADQLSLYNLARWWAVKAGDFKTAPAPLVEHALGTLEAIAAHATTVTDELIFTCCEFAAACWRGQQAERLCQALQLLASKAGPRANPLILVELYTRHHLDSEGTPIPAQVAELFQTLHRASPFRIFDRPGSAPL